MTGKTGTVIRNLAAFVFAGALLAAGSAFSETIKMSVFERFRNEMTIGHDVAAAKFMSPNALAKWNAAIAPYFDRKDRQLSHFFAFSMLVPKARNSDFYVIYFNPWVDGALLTQWRKRAQIWKIENFYLASGERVRGEITPQFTLTRASVIPVWLRQRGRILRNIYSYYKNMRARMTGADIREYMSWLLLSDAESASDLLRVKLRMRARLELAVNYIAKDNSGPALSGAFAKVKYDAIIKDKKKLASYSRHAGLLVDLRPEIIKTFGENWYLKKQQTYSVILSSPIAPTLFLYMNIKSGGKIEGVLLGNLEAMANILQAAASAAAPVKPAQSARKVQKYNDADGNTIEVITEKRGGKVTMTTRINGVITEVLTF